jgi:hypothetical protein
MKLDPAMDRVGGQVADAVNSSNATIPSRFLAPPIEDPIMSAAAQKTSIGGTGQVDPLAELWVRSERTAPNASGPIYGPNAPADVPASDLWHSIRNIDENTRFKPDLEVEGVNEVRREMRKGLRDKLEDAVPGVKGPSQTYSDLSTAREALDRTMHSGTSINKLLDPAFFPLKTLGGTGLVKMGRGLSKINPRLLQTMPLAGMTKENR